MPLIPVHETDLSHLPGDILPQIYNGFDTTQLHPILDKLLQLPRPGPIYNLERALQGVAMEMSLRGFLIDPVVQERETVSLRSKLSTIDAVLQQLSQAVGNTSLNYDSPKQQIKFFYDVLGMRPITKRVKGELTFPMTQITLEKLQSFPRSRVFAGLILKCKEYRMLLNRFETEIDSDWRMRTSNNIAGTNERRWSNSKSAIGTGGNLQNITEDLRSMFISDPGYKLFGIDKEQAEARWVGFYCGILLDDWTYLNLLESGDGHTAVARMVWENDLPWTGDLKLDRQIANRLYTPLNDSYRQGAKKMAHACLTPDHEVLTPEGWVSITEKPNTIMEFDKENCQSQFTKVMSWTDVEYEGPMHEWTSKMLSIKMTANHRVLHKNDEVLRVCRADKTPRSTKIPLGWGFVGGTANISPEIARIIAAFQCDGSYHYRTSRIRFHLYKERKRFRIISLAEAASLEHQTYADGTIVINGTDYYPKTAGPYLLDWPLAALVAYLEEHIFWDGTVNTTTLGTTSTTIYSANKTHLEWIQTLNRLIGIGGNIPKSRISGFGSEGWRLQYNNRKFSKLVSTKWTVHSEQTRVLCPTVPGEFFYIRRNGKISITGNTNIGGRPPTIAAQHRVPIKVVEEFQDKYFTALPCIPNYQTWVANKIQTTKFLRTVFGAHRDFFDRPDSYETVKQGLAFMQAGTSADDVNLGLYRTWKQYGKTVQLLTNEHDGVYGQFKDGEDEVGLLSQIQSLFKIEFDLGFRKFSVPTEAKTGYNKGMRWKLGPDNKPYDANPRGLDKPGARR